MKQCGDLLPPRLPAAHHVSAQIDAEDGDRPQWKRDAHEDEEEEGRDLWDVAGQCVGDGLLQVVKDQTTCSDTKQRVTVLWTKIHAGKHIQAPN